MWFGKWFGARSEGNGSDEPARFAAPGTRPRAAVATTPAARKQAAPGHRKGFDPYNSGAFERRNAWERVRRR